MLIDTHCHLNIITKDNFDQPLTPKDIDIAKQIIDQANDYGINIILNVGTSLIESINCIDLAKKFPSVYAAIGIHPNDLNDNWLSDINKLKSLLEKNMSNNNELKIKAIGECGLDYHYPDYDIKKQKQGFIAQVELALEYDLPLVIHTRDAQEGVLSILEDYKNHNLRGTIHCFSEDYNFAKRALDLGFVLGIGGTITYPKNNILREVVKSVGLEHIILETDAPFLPPQYIRGKTNYPKEIKAIALFIANLLNTSIEEVAHKTTQNAKNLFKF